MCDMWYNCHMSIWTKEAFEAVLRGKATKPETWAHLKGTLAWHDGPEEFTGPPVAVKIRDGTLEMLFPIKASHSGTIVTAFLDGQKGRPLNLTVSKGSMVYIHQTIGIKDS